MLGVTALPARSMIPACFQIISLSLMVMSMEARGFGAYPQRTFVEAPHMGFGAQVACGAMLLAVVGWYTALAFGVVHSFYVFAP